MQQKTESSTAPVTPRSEVHAPSSQSVTFPAEQPLPLDCGQQLAPFTIAYQTYGTLNPGKTNAILICHALTGDQHVANDHPMTGKPGWWTTLIGPGKPIDTDTFSSSARTFSAAVWARPVRHQSTPRPGRSGA